MSSTTENSLGKSFDINDMNINPFDWSTEKLISVVPVILNKFNLISQYKIDMQLLQKFLDEVATNYHDHCAFHNFQHAWSVFHMSYQILQFGAADCLQPIDMLGLLISAICHDLDHPGNNNQFEINTNSVLYQRCGYIQEANGKIPPVLECHHLAMTMKILDKYDIFGEMPGEQKAEVHQIITKGIMSTDMSLHFELMNVLEKHNQNTPAFSKDSKTDRDDLIGLIVHSADLSGQALKLELALNWGNRCLDEFHTQVQKERELNVPVTERNLGLDDEINRLNMQIGFINVIVLRLWQSMSIRLPALQIFANQTEVNLTYYNTQLQQISQERLAKQLAKESAIAAVTAAVKVNKSVKPKKAESRREEVL